MSIVNQGLWDKQIGNATKFESTREHICVKHMDTFQRPREKFIALGGDKLDIAEILAILLRTGCKGQSSISLAKELLQNLSMRGLQLNSATIDDCMQVKGIGEDKAVTIGAAIELGRRLVETKVLEEHKDFTSPETVALYVMERVRHWREEHFMAMYLTAKNTLISIEEISKGGLTSSLAEQRVVFRYAIAHNAASIILFHNHPSGDSTPSQNDIRVTKVFRDAGQLMGIPIIDHIVIGDKNYTSLCEKGYV
ncbi:RadC family protein [Veillonella montpellierensis]|uniref:RadC family protein n=1 Tax=Veillonella montpellierensis TaxID=187328 RepID=UPI0009E01370